MDATNESVFLLRVHTKQYETVINVLDIILIAWKVLFRSKKHAGI